MKIFVWKESRSWSEIIIKTLPSCEIMPFALVHGYQKEGRQSGKRLTAKQEKS